MFVWRINKIHQLWVITILDRGQLYYWMPDAILGGVWAVFLLFWRAVYSILLAADPLALLDFRLIFSPWVYVLYSTRHNMLRVFYFWPDWNSNVKLGVFQTNFSTKRSHSPPPLPRKSQSQNNCQTLNICRVLCIWYAVQCLQQTRIIYAYVVQGERNSGHLRGETP